MEEENISELKQNISDLEQQNKRLIENQVKLGDITNNHMMLYYLVKNVNEAKSTNSLWLNYLSSILDSGFNYSDAYIVVPKKIEDDHFDRMLKLDSAGTLVKSTYNIDEAENYVQMCLRSKETFNSTDNISVAIPLLSINNEILAILVASKETGVTFEDTQLLEIYTKQTVSTIENLLLNEKLVSNQNLLAEKIDQFVMLHYISKEINDSIKYHDVIEKYLDAATSPLGFNCDAGIIYIFESDYINKVSKQKDKLKFEKIHELPEKHLIKAKETGLHTFGENKNSLAMPLNTSTSGTSAILELTASDEFSNENIQLIDIFSMQTATMLENAKLNHNLEQEVEVRTKELKKAYENLKELDGLKDEFLSMVSHELNTPLTPVLAYIETVLNSLEKPEPDTNMIKEFLDIAHIEAERLKDIIHKMIDISKLEAGKAFINNEKIDASKLIKSIYNSEKLNSPKKLNLIWDLDIDTPLHTINVDPARLEQILKNLITNAVNFNKRRGQVSISAKSLDNSVVISVRDTGIGISEDNFENIFSRFKQLQKIDHHSRGAGLGLPLVHLLVNNMNGEIDFKTKLKEGSTFIVKFPISD